MKVWACKVGEVDPGDVPEAGDAPMRDAVERAFRRVTGVDAQFVFSGWGAELSEPERAVVENRLPSEEHYARWLRDREPSVPSSVARDLEAERDRWIDETNEVGCEASRLESDILDISDAIGSESINARSIIDKAEALKAVARDLAEALEEALGPKNPRGEHYQSCPWPIVECRCSKATAALVRFKESLGEGRDGA